MSYKETRDLISDLVAIGVAATSPDPDTMGGYLSLQRGRAVAIGRRLNAIGGMSVMVHAHATVASRVGGHAARELEMAWSGIGHWVD